MQLYSLQPSKVTQMKTISLNDLLDRLRSPTPPALVEALPPRHFVQGHLPGALNINVGEVKALAPELLPTKTAGVVVYCASASCTNSDQVAVQLLALGYTDVAVFKVGKAEWHAAGYSLEEGAPSSPQETACSR